MTMCLNAEPGPPDEELWLTVALEGAEGCDENALAVGLLLLLFPSELFGRIGDLELRRNSADVRRPMLEPKLCELP